MKRKIPFPQANNIELIYKVLFDIGPNGLSKFDVSKKYKMKEREGSYYLDALLFLGLVEKVKIKYFLNEKGRNIRLLSSDNSLDGFKNVLFENAFIKNTYRNWENIIDDGEKKKYLSSCIYNGEYGLNPGTSYRRAECINAWFKWLNE